MGCNSAVNTPHSKIKDLTDMTDEYGCSNTLLARWVFITVIVGLAHKEVDVEHLKLSAVGISYIEYPFIVAEVKRISVGQGSRVYCRWICCLRCDIHGKNGYPRCDDRQ